MIEEVEYNGFWFFPDDPERQYSGTLTYGVKKGAQLTLIGSIEKNRGRDVFMLEEADCIWGCTNGGNITLFNCYRLHSRYGGQNIFCNSYFVRLVLVGAHYEKESEIRFKEMIFRLSHLDEWLNISGINLKHTKDSNSRYEENITYNQPQTIQIDSLPGYTIYIHFFHSTNLSHSRPTAHVEQKASLRIEADQESPFKDYLNIKKLIQNFLSLAVISPVHTLRLEGFNEQRKSNFNGAEYNEPIKIFYKIPKYAARAKTIMPGNMLFTYADTSDNLGAYLENWVNKAEQLKPVYDLYFGIVYMRRTYLQHAFLTFMQALESYHRRTRKNYELPKEVHRKRLDEILTNTPDQYKEWLKNRLDFSNEVTLQARIEELLNENPTCFDRCIPDKDTFIRKIVKTRNYLTHFDKKLEKKAATDDEYPDLIDKLMIILRVLLLKELGFSSDEIKVARDQDGDYFTRVEKNK